MANPGELFSETGVALTKINEMLKQGGAPPEILQLAQQILEMYKQLFDAISGAAKQAPQGSPEPQGAVPVPTGNTKPAI